MEHIKKESKQELYSTLDLANKAEWEGGIIGLLEYGIHVHEISDENIKNLWAKLELLYKEMQPIIEKIDDIFEKVLEEDIDE